MVVYWLENRSIKKLFVPLYAQVGIRLLPENNKPFLCPREKVTVIPQPATFHSGLHR